MGKPRPPILARPKEALSPRHSQAVPKCSLRLWQRQEAQKMLLAERGSEATRKPRLIVTQITDPETLDNSTDLTAVASSGLFGKWRPIEEAPRDGTRILVPMGGCIVIASWCDQKYHKNPHPYWQYTMRGVRWDRENQPEVWMPLPEMPNVRTEAGQETKN